MTDPPGAPDRPDVPAGPGTAAAPSPGHHPDAPPPGRRLRDVARVVMGAALAYAGVGHLTFLRDEFRAQVPDWLPLGKDATVVASGVVEVALGAALAGLPRHRCTTGALAALFFVAVFPGNVSQYLDHEDAFGLDSDRARLIRLFFQPVLVAWALWAGEVLRPTARTGRRRG